VKTTTEERRKVENNLQRLLEMVATHVGSLEVRVEVFTEFYDSFYTLFL
jgi:kinetochore protein NDC80